MREYHDSEWGEPVREDRKLFEYLLLDAFQAGLSWEIVLKKREGFRRAFRAFDPASVASMTDEELSLLSENAEIIRNRAKIFAARANASAFLAVASEFGAFADYFWSYVSGRTIQGRYERWQDIPAETAESQSLSKDMKRRGFKFAGPTIIYAVMQSAGLANDHVTSCFRYPELSQ